MADRRDINVYPVINFESIEDIIFEIRGSKVIIDSDSANLYGVTTKRLNEQVKRIKYRFPEDFMFKLTKKEKSDLVAKCDRLKLLKFSTVNPNAFSEYGALMLVSVINSR
jgi:hypothetical protein